MGFTDQRLAVILAVIALTGAACGTSGNPAPIAPTPPSETSERQPVQATERILLPSGGFTAFVSGTAVDREPVKYVLEVAEGQSLILAISSVEANAVYDVFSPLGAPLATEQTEGAIAVREPGDHQIVVSGTPGNATYDLNVNVHPAERVRFVHGAIGTTVTDSVLQGERDVHILSGLAEVTLSVTISSIGDTAVFDIYPPNGPRLIEGATTIELMPPENGDYHVVVAGTNGNVTYDLKVLSGP